MAEFCNTNSKTKLHALIYFSSCWSWKCEMQRQDFTAIYHHTPLQLARTQHMRHVWLSVWCSAFMITIAFFPYCMEPKTHSDTEKLWSPAVATWDMQSWHCYSSFKASSKSALKARGKKILLNLLPSGQDLGETCTSSYTPLIHIGLFLLFLCVPILVQL